MKMVRARVVIVERRIPFTLDKTKLELVHEKDATNERLSFQTMVVTAEISREVYGSELLPSTSTAKGKVVFFNEYSTSTQTVTAKTKLIGSNGKRYQTLESATVPGYTLVNKKKTAGTSNPVSIVAVDTGPSYNSAGLSFIVNGWTGSKSKTFFARSVGPIAGGEAGVAHMVSDADKDEVVATLHAQLIERLKRETRTQIPENLVLFPELQFVTIDADSLVLKGDSIKFPAKIKGSMVSYLIPRSLLENAIAQNALSKHSYSDVYIPALGDMTVEPVTVIPTKADIVPPSIVISLSGQGTIVTKAPVNKIKESLLGIPRSRFTDILPGFDEIDTARYSLYPFWAPLFPDAESKITVTVE